MVTDTAPDIGTRSWKLEAYVVGIAVSGDGATFAAALGDGSVRLIATDALTPQIVQTHDGACLCLATDVDGKGFLTGGDDGRVVRTDVHGSSDALAESAGKWIEHIVAHPGSGFRAYAAGKDVFVMERVDRGKPRKLTHSSTVAGLAINEKGRRLAVSHYNGVSLWWLAAKDGKPQVLEWKGSNLAVVFSRGGDYVISAQQNNALHGWRLSDGQHLRMTGYGAKVRSMAFSRKGQILATGGSDSVVCWPFTGGGPMGKSPLEFGGGVAGAGAGSPVTAVACNPKQDLVAAGFANGAVILGYPGAQRAFTLSPARTAPVTALCWTGDGHRLLIGDEAGDVVLKDFNH